MASKDFNTFMDCYIENRRTGTVRPSQVKKKQRDEEHERVPTGVNSSSVYIIKRPKTLWENIMEAFTGTEEEDFEAHKTKKKTASEAQEFEEDYKQLEKEDERKGIWHRITQLFATNVNETYEEMDEVERQEHQPKQQVPQRKTPPVTRVTEANVKEEKVSWLTSTLRFFGIEDHDDTEEDSEQGTLPEKDESMEKMLEMREDLKEIAVIATAAFKKLPKEQFDMFKNSADFAKFKKILAKHNIIKHKE